MFCKVNMSCCYCETLNLPFLLQVHICSFPVARGCSGSSDYFIPFVKVCTIRSVVNRITIIVRSILVECLQGASYCCYMF